LKDFASSLPDLLAARMSATLQKVV